MAGTIEHVEGPLSPNVPPGTDSQTPGISRCQIHYFRSTGTSAVSFRFRFTMTGTAQPRDDPTACRGSQ